MSWIASNRLSRSKYSIAIAGASGNIGSAIASSIAQNYKSFFSPIILLTRKRSSKLEGIREKLSQNVKLVEIDLGSNLSDEAISQLKQSLGSIDVVVNALPSSAKDAKLGIFKLALATGAQVYFPGEFGIDHRLNEFETEHYEWAKKKEHDKEVRAIAKEKNSRIKIVSLFVGLFLEDSISTLFGMDRENGHFISYGSSAVPIAFTSKADVGRAVAEVSLLAVSPDHRDELPNELRIAGSNLSMRQIKDILDNHTKSSINLEEEDLGKMKAQVQENYRQQVGYQGAAPYIRVVIGEGKLDWRESNQNEAVNPEERAFRWTTVERYLEDVTGKE